MSDWLQEYLERWRQNVMNKSLGQYVRARLEADIARCEGHLASLAKQTLRRGAFWKSDPEQGYQQELEKYRRWLAEIEALD
jgi:hypothetical protein